MAYMHDKTATLNTSDINTQRLNTHVPPGDETDSVLKAANSVIKVRAVSTAFTSHLPVLKRGEMRTACTKALDARHVFEFGDLSSFCQLPPVTWSQPCSDCLAGRRATWVTGRSRQANQSDNHTAMK